MGRTVDAPERKMVIFCAASLLILLVSLSGCGSDIVPAPTPTPPAAETTIPASPSPVQPSSAPDEVYFPKPSSLLYDMEAPYANLFDAIMDYYWQGYPNYFILPTFSVWGSYSLGDTREVYIVDADLWSFGEYSAAQKSVEYGALRTRFKIVLEHSEEALTVTSTEEIYDGDLLEACRPIPELYDSLAREEPVEPVWSFIPLKTVLETYCANCDIEVDFIVNWGGDLIPLAEFAA